VNIADTTVLPNNKFTAWQNQVDWNQKIKQILWYQIVGPVAFTLIFHNLGLVVVVTDTLKGPHEEVPMAAFSLQAVGWAPLD
jgi:hypothetical protein